MKGRIFRLKPHPEWIGVIVSGTHVYEVRLIEGWNMGTFHKGNPTHHIHLNCTEKYLEFL